MTQPRQQQEGAVMFLVMMIIMMASTTATFAVHIATMEMRGRGYIRQGMQTGYLAEATMVAAVDWVEWLGPNNLKEQVETNGITFSGNFPEVDLATGRYAYRLYKDTLDGLLTTDPSPIHVNAAIAEDGAYGPGNIYEPKPFADIYDLYDVTLPIPGMPADRQAGYKYLRATITARGRGGVPDDVTATGDPREYNEAARDVRAYVVMGPYFSGD